MLTVEQKRDESREEKTMNIAISSMIGIGLYQLQFANNDELDTTRRKMVGYVTLLNLSILHIALLDSTVHIFICVKIWLLTILISIYPYCNFEVLVSHYFLHLSIQIPVVHDTYLFLSVNSRFSPI